MSNFSPPPPQAGMSWRPVTTLGALLAAIGIVGLLGMAGSRPLAAFGDSWRVWWGILALPVAAALGAVGLALALRAAEDPWHLPWARALGAEIAVVSLLGLMALAAGPAAPGVAGPGGQIGWAMARLATMALGSPQAATLFWLVTALAGAAIALRIGADEARGWLAYVAQTPSGEAGEPPKRAASRTTQPSAPSPQWSTPPESPATYNEAPPLPHAAPTRHPVTPSRPTHPAGRPGPRPTTPPHAAPPRPTQPTPPARPQTSTQHTPQTTPPPLPRPTGPLPKPTARPTPTASAPRRPAPAPPATTLSPEEALYREAKALAASYQQSASAALLQRKLRLSYPQAKHLYDRLVADGLVVDLSDDDRIDDEDLGRWDPDSGL